MGILPGIQMVFFFRSFSMNSSRCSASRSFTKNAPKRLVGNSFRISNGNSFKSFIGDCSRNSIEVFPENFLMSGLSNSVRSLLRNSISTSSESSSSSFFEKYLISSTGNFSRNSYCRCFGSSLSSCTKTLLRFTAEIPLRFRKFLHGFLPGFPH